MKFVELKARDIKLLKQKEHHVPPNCIYKMTKVVAQLFTINQEACVTLVTS